MNINHNIVNYSYIRVVDYISIGIYTNFQQKQYI